MCAIESEMRRYSDGSRNAMLGVKGIWEAHGPLRENSRGKLQNVVRNSRVVNYRPVISGVAPVAAYGPVIAAPVVTYRPMLPSYASPIVGPTASHYPTAAYYPATTAYPVGRTVIVRPKVYVSGQPIRNILRAITP